MCTSLPQADVALGSVVNCPQGLVPPSRLENLLMANHTALTMSKVVKRPSSHQSSVLEKRPSSCVLPQGQGSNEARKEHKRAARTTIPLILNVHVACEAVRVGLKLNTQRPHSFRPTTLPKDARIKFTAADLPLPCLAENPHAGLVPMAGQLLGRLCSSGRLPCPGRTCPHPREGLSRDGRAWEGVLSVQHTLGGIVSTAALLAVLGATAWQQDRREEPPTPSLRPSSTRPPALGGVGSGWGRPRPRDASPGRPRGNRGLEVACRVHCPLESRHQRGSQMSETEQLGQHPSNCRRPRLRERFPPKITENKDDSQPSFAHRHRASEPWPAHAGPGLGSV